MLPQQYCLRWKYHHSNLQTMFSQLLDRGCFCDVTLACEGQLIRAHRVVLCACSTFFDTVLTNYASERDPIIIMKDVTFADIKCLIEFMYKGEINVEHANLASLLKTADDLKIKGLAEVTWRDDEDIPPPPTPQTEFHSPTQARRRDSQNYDNYSHEAQQRSQTPDIEREQKTPSPKHLSSISGRLPTLTPIPTSAVSIITASSSPIDSYLGPKRKRGRPPLDDAYDVFNVRKLGHYSDPSEGTYLESSQYNEESNNQGTTQHSRPNSPLAAPSAYQQHIQQQKQRLRYRSSRSHQQDDQIDDETATEPEWITSSLEHETNETKTSTEQNDKEEQDENESQPQQNDKDEHEEISIRRPSEKRSKESLTPEHPKMKALKRKNSKEETLQQHKVEKQDDDADEVEPTDLISVPQTVEEIDSVQQPSKEKSSTNTPHNSSTSSSTIANSSSSATSSSTASPTSTGAGHKATSSSTTSSSSHSSQHHHHSHHGHQTHSHHTAPPPAPPLHSHTHHFGKYVPDGYLINEHGILMTHDFIHAPTASIPTSSSMASNGHHPDDYVDIKMEEFSEAELRLTSEEMTQWQDVIKMDDYLAKGRRPQFWEEPFTRRVLDAIKNKRLEMKKAARILGVSYGTLYGRYREVYGCLKHPYSTSLRPSQNSALSVQPRFDIVWPSPKPGQLDIGKLRPKDLSELWTRPQI